MEKRYDVGNWVVDELDDLGTGIVVEEQDVYGNYGVYFDNKGVYHRIDSDLRSDLTRITKPFGLLTPYIQEELKKAWNVNVNGDSNIQRYESTWESICPLWCLDNVYRLDPEYKEPEKIKVIITKNGEPINEPLSIETARRLGIVE